MSEKEKPVCAGTAPIILEMEPGEYSWCSCGKSENQPFCDGSHKGTDFVPQKVVIDRSRKFAWCACKASEKGAQCDGSHNNLIREEL